MTTFASDGRLMTIRISVTWHLWRREGLCDGGNNGFRARRLSLRARGGSSTREAWRPRGDTSSNGPASRGPCRLRRGSVASRAYLGARGRPLTAFCACELRSPGQFTEDGFVAFNRAYVGTLERWGIFKDEDNPVARFERLPGGRPAGRTRLSRLFVHRAGRAGRRGRHEGASSSRGSGEAAEGPGDYADRIIRLGRHRRRMPCGRRRNTSSARWSSAWRALGLTWADATVSQVYTVHAIHGFPRRRGHPPRRGAGRCHLDLRPTAGRGIGF